MSISIAIALFVYKRPDKTTICLESISKNEGFKNYPLYIFADGPTAGASPADLAAISQVKAVINKQWAPHQVIALNETNQGLGKSIIAGIDKLLEQYDSVIVLEDDLVFDPEFLNYMNYYLNYFKDSYQIKSVNGYMFPLNMAYKNGVLLPLTSSWGWATWRKHWMEFKEFLDQPLLVNLDPPLIQRYNLGKFNFAGMLEFPIEKSWGIRWYHYNFVTNGLGVFPSQSLVMNDGADHSKTNHYDPSTATSFGQIPFNFSHPKTIDIHLYNKLLNHLAIKNDSVASRAWSRLINLFK
ncbi:MAG: hypothetical protein RIQ89_1296 [Bacteroidota bacterium]|jgi:hypothetical protein